MMCSGVPGKSRQAFETSEIGPQNHPCLCDVCLAVVTVSGSFVASFGSFSCLFLTVIIAIVYSGIATVNLTRKSTIWTLEGSLATHTLWLLLWHCTHCHVWQLWDLVAMWETALGGVNSTTINYWAGFSLLCFSFSVSAWPKHQMLMNLLWLVALSHPYHHQSTCYHVILPLSCFCGRWQSKGCVGRSFGATFACFSIVIVLPCAHLKVHLLNSW